MRGLEVLSPGIELMLCKLLREYVYVALNCRCIVVGNSGGQDVGDTAEDTLISAHNPEDA